MANTDFEWVASGLLLYPLKTSNRMGNYPIANFVYFPIFNWKWERPTIYYHGFKSILQAVFHTPPFRSNTHAPGGQLKTLSGTEKYGQ